MGGALLQLVAKGNQDTHLIGNPNTTYFKNIYKRHTNFSFESIEVNFNENVNFGVYSSAFIPRKGDLLHKIFLEVDLPALKSNVSWINGIGHHLIEYVELRMGGVLVDKIYGELLDVWSELTTPIGQQGGYYKMVGKFASFNEASQTGSLKLFIPLPFWFCRDISRSLPLISLQYTDIKVSVKFRTFDELWYKNTAAAAPTTRNITKAVLYCDFIFLDTYERKQFAGMKEDNILIEQFQVSDGHNVLANQTSSKIELNFNHSIKEIYWIYQSDTYLAYNDWGNYSHTNISNKKPFTNIELKFNNNDRFKKRSAEYFRLVQPYNHHTRSPEDYIYMYSFALHPERMQPSGSCNFSKLDSAILLLEYQNSIGSGKVTVYAINYNILNIKNGMAGLMYSS